MVRRGEIVLDFNVIDNWNNELNKMNHDKEGASYRYPDSFVQLEPIPNYPSELSIWQRGTREARTVLYYLSKNKTILEVIRNGQPRSKTTTYQINSPID